MQNRLEGLRGGSDARHSDFSVHPFVPQHGDHGVGYVVVGCEHIVHVAIVGVEKLLEYRAEL